MMSIINFKSKRERTQEVLDQLEVNKLNIHSAVKEDRIMPSGDKETIITIVIRKIFRREKNGTLE